MHLSFAQFFTRIKMWLVLWRKNAPPPLTKLTCFSKMTLTALRTFCVHQHHQHSKAGLEAIFVTPFILLFYRTCRTIALLIPSSSYDSISACLEEHQCWRQAIPTAVSHPQVTEVSFAIDLAPLVVNDAYRWQVKKSKKLYSPLSMATLAW